MSDLKKFDGPTVNGRPLLTVAEVLGWAKEVHAHLSRDGAARIASELNHASWLALTLLTRNEWPATKRLAEISADLTRLRANLSELVADTRRIQPDADTSVTDQLLHLIDQHANLILEKRQGRPPDPRTNLPRNIGHLFRSIREEEKPNRRTTNAAANAFAETAARWVLDDPLVIQAGKAASPKASSIGRQNRRKKRT